MEEEGALDTNKSLDLHEEDEVTMVAFVDVVLETFMTEAAASVAFFWYACTDRSCLFVAEWGCERSA